MPKKRSPAELLRLAELKFLVEYFEYLEKTKNLPAEVPLIDVNYDLHNLFTDAPAHTQTVSVPASTTHSINTTVTSTVIPKPTLGHRGKKGV